MKRTLVRMCGAVLFGGLTAFLTHNAVMTGSWFSTFFAICSAVPAIMFLVEAA